MINGSKRENEWRRLRLEFPKVLFNKICLIRTIKLPRYFLILFKTSAKQEMSYGHKTKIPRLMGINLNTVRSYKIYGGGYGKIF